MSFGDRMVRSELVVTEVQREDLRSDFNCSVKNNEGFSTRKVQLDLEGESRLHGNTYSLSLLANLVSLSDSPCLPVSLSLPVCLSTCPSLYLFLCVPGCVPTCVSLYTCVCPPVCLSVDLYVCCSLLALSRAGLWSGGDYDADAGPLPGLPRVLVGTPAALPLLVWNRRALHRYM